MFYEILGKISFAIIVTILSLFLLSLILGLLLVKKDKLVLPKILLFTIDTFYLQIKRIASMFGLGDKIIDQIGVEVRNSLNMRKFAKVNPKDRILIVPQCLRNVNCPARLNSSTGIACKECGMCVIKDVKEEAKRLGYGFYIVPGGSFVERIVRAVRPKAALGVACARDLNMGMHGISRTKCAVQGVSLIKDGCVNTEIDVKELFRKMRSGIEDGIEEIGERCEDYDGSKGHRIDGPKPIKS